MNNECEAQYIDANAFMYTCHLMRNHEGAHYDYGTRRTWPQNHPNHGHYANYSWVVDEEVAAVKATMKQTSVLLTVEDLKGLSYALSGPEWLEDEPELVAKIDNALKGML